MDALARRLKQLGWGGLRPFHDLGVLTWRERRIIQRGLAEVTRMQHLMEQARYVAKFEEDIATAVQSPHAITLASGTDALYFALQQAGVGPGKAVITSTNTWITTLTTVHELGATCQFVDVEPGTGLMDPAKIEQTITPETVVIMPIHMYGSMVRMDVVMDISRRHGLRVIEDACQAIGASLHGRAAGTWGDAGCFSFHSTKLVGAPSDGGLLVTPHQDWAEAIRKCATACWEDALVRRQARIPSRLPALAVPFLRARLSALQQRVEGRRAQWHRYEAVLRDVRGLEIIRPSPGVEGSYRNCIVMTPHKEAIMEACRRSGLPLEEIYPQSKGFLERIACGDVQGMAPSVFPAAAKLAASGLALPLGRHLKGRHIDAVADIIRNCHL